MSKFNPRRLLDKTRISSLFPSIRFLAPTHLHRPPLFSSCPYLASFGIMAISSANVKLTTCLFFESEAEEAAKFYVSIFPNSSVETTSHFLDEGKEHHRQSPGSVMILAFNLNGHSFTALNSKPADIKFNESISFQVICDTQEEIDYYWDKLSEGGDETKQICGWTRDKYGVSWQVVPKIIPEIMNSGDKTKQARVTLAFMKMKKIIIKDILDAVEQKD